MGDKLTTLFSHKKLDEAFAEMRRNKDGEVTIEEFIAWHHRNHPTEPKHLYAQLLHLFNVIDSKRLENDFDDSLKKGCFRKQDVSDLLKSAGNHIAGKYKLKKMKSIDDAFQEMDKTGTGFVSHEEFVLWYCLHLNVEPPKDYVEHIKMLQKEARKGLAKETFEVEKKIGYPFNQIDEDHSGTLTKKEVGTFAKQIGDKVNLYGDDSFKLKQKSSFSRRFSALRRLASPRFGRKRRKEKLDASVNTKDSSSDGRAENVSRHGGLSPSLWSSPYANTSYTGGGTDINEGNETKVADTLLTPFVVCIDPPSEEGVNPISTFAASTFSSFDRNEELDSKHLHSALKKSLQDMELATWKVHQHSRLRGLFTATDSPCRPLHLQFSKDIDQPLLTAKRNSGVAWTASPKSVHNHTPEDRRLYQSYRSSTPSPNPIPEYVQTPHPRSRMKRLKYDKRKVSVSSDSILDPEQRLELESLERLAERVRSSNRSKRSKSFMKKSLSTVAGFSPDGGFGEMSFTSNSSPFRPSFAADLSDLNLNLPFETEMSDTEKLVKATFEARLHEICAHYDAHIKVLKNKIQYSSKSSKIGSLEGESFRLQEELEDERRRHREANERNRKDLTLLQSLHTKHVRRLQHKIEKLQEEKRLKIEKVDSSTTSTLKNHIIELESDLYAAERKMNERKIKIDNFEREKKMLIHTHKIQENKWMAEKTELLEKIKELENEVENSEEENRYILNCKPTAILVNHGKKSKQGVQVQYNSKKCAKKKFKDNSTRSSRLRLKTSQRNLNLKRKKGRGIVYNAKTFRNSQNASGVSTSSSGEDHNIALVSKFRSPKGNIF
eukprot:g2751.t1